jgi:hypothetical protein
MIEQGNFFVKCHNIYYNQHWLIYVLDSLKPSDWVTGYSRTGVAWNVSESYKIPYENMWKDIVENMNLDQVGSTERTKHGQKPWCFFSKLPPGGINLHYDHRRWGAVLFPVRGKFEVTPQIFATENYTEIERFNFEKSKIHNNGTPVFFDSRVLHAVPTPLDLEEERVVFSVNIHSHPTEFFRKAIDGTWLNKNTENIGVSND